MVRKPTGVEPLRIDMSIDEALLALSKNLTTVVDVLKIQNDQLSEHDDKITRLIRAMAIGNCVRCGKPECIRSYSCTMQRREVTNDPS